METIKEQVSNLTRLVLRAYSDEAFKDEVGIYQTMLNPANYSETYSSKYNQTTGFGKPGGLLKYMGSFAGDISIDFLFDRTGVIPNMVTQMANELQDAFPGGRDLGVGILADITIFKNAVYKFNTDQHEPNYVRINWGTLNFTGKLTDLTIDYKLFGPNGKPLRAVAKAKFTHCAPSVKKNPESNKSNSSTDSTELTSPDLTHIRTVQGGDTLPLMAFKIYGDSKYYLEVAKANGLSSFRKLTVGQQIFFPPLQKQS